MLRPIGFTAVVLAGALAWAPPLLADAASETVTASTHADLAATASDLKGVHTHLHHTLNCLVGPGGFGFDARQLNPCAQSGNGAIPDTTDAAKKPVLQSAANKAREGISSSDKWTAQAAATAAASMLKGAK